MKSCLDNWPALELEKDWRKLDGHVSCPCGASLKCWGYGFAVKVVTGIFYHYIGFTQKTRF